ncbi:MAG: AAA family ATPase [Bacteroidetes bacterium]|nr:MAG: AAA family ATPase [Bacteroidota bacterium]
MMKNLPIGKQEFSVIREANDLYVDKTTYIYQLITTGGGYYFLSRPRRFGKSLLLNTIKELFLGNKQYFEGLYIADKWDFKPYPVIKLDFGKPDYKTLPFLEVIKKQLKNIASDYEVMLEESSPKEMLNDLIVGLAKHGKVVILIDEYDKPIIDYLEDVPKAKEQRDLLKNLYAAIKPLDAYLKFVMLTGVSKFGKVSIFSDLNNLDDITLAPAMANICGYTQQELETNFAEHIIEVGKRLHLTKEELLPKIKQWYNGYAWHKDDTVYNPFSILKFLHHKNFDNYWFSTGTPTFLTKLLQKDFHYEFKDTIAGFASFDTSELDNLDYVAVLFQTGYLTIKEDLGYGMYGLDFPNLEVQNAFSQYLLAEYAYQQPGRMQPAVFQLFRYLQNDNFQEVHYILNGLFATIPQDYFLENREKFYHAIVYLVFRLLGYFTQIELNSGRGRLDCVVFWGNKVFLFEFKLDKSAEEAIAQIKAKNYYAPYQGVGKDIYLIGVNMTSAQKQIDEFLVEKV